MACKELFIALSMIAASSPGWASQGAPSHGAGAPQAPAGARYCLRVDPITGTRIESIQCRTRDDWAGLGVDVDQEWADNGVTVLGAAGLSG